ncbi:MAG TPA: T9SS type A sorting domain-containing protein, partial [Spirochaetota bacterium]|nr:T9SS type A sorting domain-containing protein [Spirochaetota bacterium]
APNPFSFSQDKTLVISHTGDNTKDIKLYIYNTMGEFVTLLSPDADNNFYWKGKNYYGDYVSPGIYLLKLNVNNEFTDIIQKIIIKK